MVGFDDALRVVGIDVEGIEMGADGPDGGEVLDAAIVVTGQNGEVARVPQATNQSTHLRQASAHFQDLALGGALIACDFRGSHLGK